MEEIEEIPLKTPPAKEDSELTVADVTFQMGRILKELRENLTNFNLGENNTSKNSVSPKQQFKINVAKCIEKALNASESKRQKKVESSNSVVKRGNGDNKNFNKTKPKLDKESNRSKSRESNKSSPTTRSNSPKRTSQNAVKQQPPKQNQNAPLNFTKSQQTSNQHQNRPPSSAKPQQTLKQNQNTPLNCAKSQQTSNQHQNRPPSCAKPQQIPKQNQNSPPSSAKPQQAPKQNQNISQSVVKPQQAPNQNQNRPSSSAKPQQAYNQHQSRPLSSTNSSRQRAVSPIFKHIPFDPLQPLKETVERAIRDRKTFTVCGTYYYIRKALLDRGWVERMRIYYHMNYCNNVRNLHCLTLHELMAGINDKEQGLLYRRVIMSKLLGHHQVDFYWDDVNDAFKVNNDRVKLTLINKFRRTVFSYTSKQGLCEAIKDAHWYQKPGTSNIRHPRSYSLTNNGDPQDFIEDYKITAAASLLKWIIHTYNQGKVKLISPSGKIPMQTFHFAIEECMKRIKKAKHEDIDYEIQEALEYDWNQFLGRYYKLVHIGNHFKKDKSESEESMVEKAKYVLSKMEKYFPHLDMDGMMNIWILKPICGSRGQGIHICRTLEYILKIVKTNVNLRYVIQKYIEKPLLIYNTKFDIRQWFLISSSVPLTIWMYKECYLRFSSQTYNLRKLHESIHLTNNSVQSKYKNQSRDQCIPHYNMWDTQQFKQYLSDIGYPNAYNKIIYPGMKESITGAILLNQCYLDQRKNSFELYGADFMLTEDFQPWLIEINSKPALGHTTPVTAKMCPKVLEDVIKVIIDLPKNPKANTGNFEMVYRQTIPKLPNVDTTQLVLEGTPLSPEYFYTPGEDQASTAYISHETMSKEIMKITEAHRQITQVSAEMKKALKNLLTVIQNERKRRHELRNENLQQLEYGNDTETKKIPETVENEVPLHIKSEKNLNQGDTKDSDEEIKQSDSTKLNEPITQDESKIIKNILVELNEPQTLTDVMHLLNDATTEK